MRPGTGGAIYRDDFSKESLWFTGRVNEGNITITRNEITLAISQPKITLASLNNELVVQDFFLELNASSSLCRDDDHYGILARASSPTDGYRLLVNCSGLIRLERIKNMTLVVLQDWTASGQIRPGPLQNSRLGFWAQGREIRIFINDVFQFSASDPVWQSGQIGVIARTAGDTPLTVSFSDLQVYSLDESLANRDLSITRVQ